MASSAGPPSASKYTCKCLNVTIYARQGIYPKPLRPVHPRDFTDITEHHLSQKIFEGSTQVAEIELDVGGVRNELKLLLSTEVIGNWSFFHCLNCKTSTHCIRFRAFSVAPRSTHVADVDNYNPPDPLSPNSTNPPHHTFLLNITHMISDQKMMTQLEHSQDFSPLFRILLPTTWTASSNERRSSSSSDFPHARSPLSPTSPPNIQPNSGRRVSVNPSSASAEKLDPAYKQLAQSLQEGFNDFVGKEEENLEKKIKEFADEQRKLFEARTEKARRDRVYLLNLVRSSLDQSSAVRSLRAGRPSSSSSHDGADDVFQNPRSRRESAPTRPINIGAAPFPAPINLRGLGSPLGIGTPPYGGLVEVNRGSVGKGSSSALQPITLTMPLVALPNQSTSNNNHSSPRDRGQREAKQRQSSPPAGLFAMDDDEDNDDEEDDYEDVDHRDDVNDERTGYAQVEEEELEDLAAITNHDSPFEAVEISDGETDPDDNSLEDLRRTGPGAIPARLDTSLRDRKLSKYSTSAPMNIDLDTWPQSRNPPMDSPLEEAEPDEENERDSREDQRGTRGAPLSQEQIATEMQSSPQVYCSTFMLGIGKMFIRSAVSNALFSFKIQLVAALRSRAKEMNHQRLNGISSCDGQPATGSKHVEMEPGGTLNNP